MALPCRPRRKGVCQRSCHHGFTESRGHPREEGERERGQGPGGPHAHAAPAREGRWHPTLQMGPVTATGNPAS